MEKIIIIVVLQTIGCLLLGHILEKNKVPITNYNLFIVLVSISLFCLAGFL